jgi:peptidoglycan/LPS O-acetylase OafA/YrhL
MPYVRQIDGLRFFSFLAVFLFHCQPRKLWFGAYGVHLFFTLSGFLITWLLLASEGPSRWYTVVVFYARRALRIFPAYYLAIGLGLALGTLLLPHWHAIYLYNLRVFYASTQVDVTPFFARYKGTGTHFWSLCIEEQFYLVYPWLLLMVPRARRALFLGGLIVLAMASRALLAAAQPTCLYGLLLPVCAEYLAWGALAALLLKERRFPAIPNGLLLWGGLLATLGLCFLPRPPGASPLQLQFQPGSMQTVRALAFTALIVGLWRDRASPLTRFLRLGPLVFLGKISYGLYLYHLFVFEPYEALVRALPWVARLNHDLVLLGLTVAFATVSWYGVERPLNRLKDRLPYLGERPASP